MKQSGEEMDAIMQRFDREAAERHERVRQVLLSEERPDLVAELDGKMRDIRLGLDGARSTWHALSPAQRQTLTAICKGSRKLIRMKGRKSYNFGIMDTPGRVAGLATVRNLIARELLACEGGAFDPERVVVITERGRFVVKHGAT